MPPARGRRRPDELEGVLRRAQKRRERVRSRRRRHIALVLAAIVLPLTLLVATGFGGAVAFYTRSHDCNLNNLHPVSIGVNSFVYAADGTLLGSIPAEKNRQPVGLAQISPWMRKPRNASRVICACASTSASGRPGSSSEPAASRRP